MPRIPIQPEGVKKLAAPLTPGVRKGNMLQVAGQISFNGGTIVDQTREAMHNVIAVLEAGGATLDDVIMMRVYLTDTAHFAEMNDTYREFLTEPYPARTTIYVGLPPGLLIEIDALAVLDD